MIKPHQRAAEQALRLKALDFINDGVLIVDGRGQILYADPSMRRLLNLAPDQELRTTADLQSFLRFQEPLSFDGILALTQTSGQWSGEATALLSDQQPLLLDIQTHTLTNTDGAQLGIVFVARDVTRERSLEKQVLLSQQMELVESFLGGIAHEFKNQLTVLMAYATLLKDQLRGQPGEEDTGKILETAQKANELTSRMMAVTRPTPLRMENSDIFGVLNDLFAMLRKTFPNTIELMTPAVKNLPRVYCDPSILYRAILNLCLNARDALPNGGRISIEIDWICLDQEDLAAWPDRHPGVYMILAVTDTGTGIPAEIKDRIFEPFFTTKKTGTGLGLSVVEHTLKTMGGWITAASQEGKGSCFRVYVPAAQQEGIFMKEEGEDNEPATGTETILAVDDDPVILSMIQRYLEKSGFTVWTADGGEKALAIFREHASEIHLAVLDVVMPGMNGEDVYRELRKIRPDLPVLIISGFPLDTAEILLAESKAPFLGKPFSRARITRTIRRVLDTPAG